MAEVPRQLFFLYLILINLTGFAAMGIDKHRARRHRWRVRERTFFLIALLLGSAGCWAGMYVFRHKTRHWYFVFGLPAILAAQAAVGLLIRNYWHIL